MIDCERITIRSFSPDDHTDLFEYLSDPEIYRFESGKPISEIESRQLASERSQSNAYLAVELKPISKLIGHLYFNHNSPSELLTWELGYIFNPRFQRNGYATEACKALVSYAFTHYETHRIIAHCDPGNVPSWRVLEKAGFTREAHLRKNIFFRKDAHGNPVWTDTYEYALLAQDLQ